MPPKPLNLLSFARARAPGPAKIRAAAATSSETASVRPTAWAAEDAGPAITGTAAAPEAPTPSPVRSAKPGSSAKPGGGGAAPKPAASAAASDNEVMQFCSNVTDPAVDARLAWQLKELEKAESQLRERIAEVEAKRAEYEKWMALRDEFLKKAEASMVEIYSRMRPEAAAPQIAGMADETAAAVLPNLTPKNSTAIFND